MRRYGAIVLLGGSLLLAGCSGLAEEHKYTLTGAAAGAGAGAAGGLIVGDPGTGALIGGLIGGVSGLLYGEYWKDELDLGL